MKAALFSVTDKTGIGLFAKRLKELFPEIQLIASGGTAKELEKFGLMPTPLETITGFPECFGGRVKTINPKIAGGLLYRRGQDDADAKRLGVPAIDLVVCNLYRFDEGTDFIESMDIGGPTLIRCGIKNYQEVAVVTDPADYASLLKQLETAGCLSLETRAELAVKAINLTANYEAKLAEELTNRLQKRQTFRPFLDRGEKLRYGENPDQEAWIYRFPEGKGIAHAEVLAGKELSYNNYEDATAAYNAASHLLSVTEAPGVAIVKHGGLCGMATAKDPKLAFRRAWQCDSLSAFGGIIACNAPLDLSFAEELKGKFFEVLIAPDFSGELVDEIREKMPAVRLLKIAMNERPEKMVRHVGGGLLVQSVKPRLLPEEEAVCSPYNGKWGVATKKGVPKEKLPLIRFGIVAINHAKSNTLAIVYEHAPDEYQLLGIGAGQPNRIDCFEKLALPRAAALIGALGLDQEAALGSSVLASDGFFPFDDTIRLAAKAGIKLCVQPGGSKRDGEVIKAADELGVAMCMTGSRYFTH